MRSVKIDVLYEANLVPFVRLPTTEKHGDRGLRPRVLGPQEHQVLAGPDLFLLGKETVVRRHEELLDSLPLTVAVVYTDGS